MLRVMVAAVSTVLVVGLAGQAAAEFIYDGSDGSMIFGEDDNGYTLSYINKSNFFDTTPNSEWTPLGRTSSSERTVGGKYYMYDSFGKVVFDDGDEAGGGNLNANAILLTSGRQVFSVTVLNNDTVAHTFNIWVEDLNIAEPYDDGSDRPPHYYVNPAADAGDDGQLITKSTGELASGEAVTMTWDLFDNDEYATLPNVRGWGNDQREAAQAGYWLAQLATRVQIGTSNTSVGYVTDIALSAIPEPGTWILMGSGMLLILGYMRRRRRKK